MALAPLGDGNTTPNVLLQCRQAAFERKLPRNKAVKREAAIIASARTGWMTNLKVDSEGALYVAQFYSGPILKISPAGRLLHIVDIAAGNGTTNVVFGER
jgi:sugar lactone lactonase YvrE